MLLFRFQCRYGRHAAPFDRLRHHADALILLLRRYFMPCRAVITAARRVAPDDHAAAFILFPAMQQCHFAPLIE